jgi:hypothetical protein
MTKLDYKKLLKPLYQPSAREVAVVDVPPLNYLMLDGQGDPNTAPAYAEAVDTLHQFIDARGRRAGKHHEIYLSDIRKANPAKWRTVIRQPLR